MNDHSTDVKEGLRFIKKLITFLRGETEVVPKLPQICLQFQVAAIHNMVRQLLKDYPPSPYHFDYIEREVRDEANALKLLPFDSFPTYAVTLEEAFDGLCELIKFLSPGGISLQHIMLHRTSVEFQLDALNAIAELIQSAYPLEATSSPPNHEHNLRRDLEEIRLLTNIALRQSWYYCGDDSTFTYLWCVSTRGLNYRRPVLLDDDIRLFGLEGNYRCEGKNDKRRCQTHTKRFYVRRGDFSHVPYSGRHLIRFLMERRERTCSPLGQLLCEKHAAGIDPCFE